MLCAGWRSSLLSAAVVDGGARLVHGEHEELGDVDVRGAGRCPDDLLGDVFRDD